MGFTMTGNMSKQGKREGCQRAVIEFPVCLCLVKAIHSFVQKRLKEKVEVCVNPV